MTTPLTVAVTGASGFVGRYVVRELLGRGHSVRALVRSRDKARQALPASDRLELIVGDISDQGIADRLLKGAQACVNLIGILRETRGQAGERPQTFERLHVGATRVLVTGCESLGVRRFAQMSALGVSDMGQTEYQRSNFEAEQIVRLSSLEWTIFRPSIIHGPEGEFVRLVKQWASGHIAPYFFMPYFTRQVEDKRVPFGPVESVAPSVQPVAVVDVARAFADCLTSPRTVGEVYNLVGSEVLSWPEMLRAMRDQIPGAHEEQPAWGISSTLAARAAHVAGLLGLGAALPFDAGMATMGAEDSTASLDKLREDFGFVPAPFRASFEQYAQRV
jgi:uncharacterized protein YbjT (DUF2867 family)